MGTAPLNEVDVAILSAVFAILALIVRGMLRGSIRSCDPSSCGGHCQGCKHPLTTSRIHLSDAQLADLAAIDAQAKEAGLQ